MADESKTNEQTERAVENPVGEYPQRPYSKAVSPEHKAFLTEQEKRSK